MPTPSLLEHRLYSTVRPAALGDLSHICPGNGETVTGPNKGLRDKRNDSLNVTGFTWVVYANDLDDAKALVVAEMWAPNGYSRGLRHVYSVANGDVRASWAKLWSGVPQPHNAD